MVRKRKNTRRGRGEGSIRQQKDGRWVVSVTVGYYPNGNPRRVVKYGKDKDEAQTKLQDLLQKHQTGELNNSSMNLKTFLEFWLESAVKPRVDPATYKVHKQRVTDYLIPHVGHVQVAKLTPFQVSQLYQDLEKEGRSADLRNKVGQLLRRALKYAVKLKMVRDNVAAEIPLPKVTEEEIHPLTEDQVKQFLRVAESRPLYPLYLMAFDTGMRQGELIALEWTDIDLGTGIVSITKSAKGGEKGGVRIKEVKTKSSRRRIKLTRRTLDALAKSKEKSTGRLVFPSRKGTYLLKCNLRTAFRRILDKAELPMIRFHDCRHTFATLALLKTKNVKAVSVRLGHEDIRVTLNTYAHWLPVMEDEIVEAMEGVLTTTEPLKYEKQSVERPVVQTPAA
jgi:integrase